MKKKVSEKKKLKFQTCCDNSPFVAIGASLGALYLVIVIMFLSMANNQLALLVPIAWAYATTAISMGFFALLHARFIK